MSYESLIQHSALMRTAIGCVLEVYLFLVLFLNYNFYCFSLSLSLVINIVDNTQISRILQKMLSFQSVGMSFAISAFVNS